MNYDIKDRAAITKFAEKELELSRVNEQEVISKSIESFVKPICSGQKDFTINYLRHIDIDVISYEEVIKVICEYLDKQNFIYRLSEDKETLCIADTEKGLELALEEVKEDYSIRGKGEFRIRIGITFIGTLIGVFIYIILSKILVFMK